MDMKKKLVEFLIEVACKWGGQIGLYGYMADRLIADGWTKQEWISVKDRLPEESGEYLAYCGEYDGVCIIYYERLKTKGKWRTKWKGETTHWMPLPQPPKGE